MYQIVLSSSFQKKVKALVKRDPKLKKELIKTIKLLRRDLKHPSLRLHKLSGQNNWSISVSRNVRIIIHWEEDILYCTKIGNHDEVY